MPGPGEFGHETWPKDSDAWMRGGANIWQTPAVDPQLGLIYFSTANPGPDLNGSVRDGDNLFANSIVAIDAKTGKYRWHFQQVHHDIWDYDSPNPVILFDAPYDGRMRKALVQVGKTGWAYILDRETGKPLLGIEDRAGAAGAAAEDGGDATVSGGRCDRAATDRHRARGGEPGSGHPQAFQRRPHLHAVLDHADIGEARHDGRSELAAQRIRPREPPALCLRVGSHQRLRRAPAARDAGTEQGLHGWQLHAGAGR